MHRKVQAGHDNDKCELGRSDLAYKAAGQSTGVADVFCMEAGAGVAQASTLEVVKYNDKCEQGRCDLAHK